jgi:hypothetical protein
MPAILRVLAGFARGLGPLLQTLTVGIEAEAREQLLLHFSLVKNVLFHFSNALFQVFQF